MGVINTQTSGGKSWCHTRMPQQKSHRAHHGGYIGDGEKSLKKTASSEVTLREPTRIAFKVQFVAYHTIVIQDESATKEKFVAENIVGIW